MEYPMSSLRSPRRRPALALVAPILPLLLAACGSSPTSSTAESSEAPSSAAVSAAPSSTSESSQPVSAGLDAAAAKALDDLTSYRFRVSVTGSTAGAPAAGEGMTMEGTVVLSPERAMDLTIAAGLTGDEALRYVLIGDQAWMDMGSGGSMPMDTQTIEEMFESFSPAELFATSYGDYLDGMTLVGDEEKNGVATRHWSASESTLAAAATLYGGGVADWQMDTWVSRDGGYLVSAVMGGSVTAEGETSSYQVAIDLFDIDSPTNVVKPPA